MKNRRYLRLQEAQQALSGRRNGTSLTAMKEEKKMKEAIRDVSGETRDRKVLAKRGLVIVLRTTAVLLLLGGVVFGAVIMKSPHLFGIFFVSASAVWSASWLVGGIAAAYAGWQSVLCFARSGDKTRFDHF